MFDEATLEKIKQGSVGRFLITELDQIKANKLNEKNNQDYTGARAAKKFCMQECVAQADSMVNSILQISRTTPDKKHLSSFASNPPRTQPQDTDHNPQIKPMTLNSKGKGKIKVKGKTAINHIQTSPTETMRFTQKLSSLQIQRDQLIEKEILRLKKKHMSLGREVWGLNKIKEVLGVYFGEFFATKKIIRMD